MIYIYSFFASLGFSFLYNIRGKLLIYTAFGGVIGMLFFNLFSFTGNPKDYFIATCVLSVYSEIMARFSKVPVTVYFIVGILPIVPGAGVYKTMFSLYEGNIKDFINFGLETLLASGAISLGIITISSIVRIFKLKKVPLLKHHLKSEYKPSMK